MLTSHLGLIEQTGRTLFSPRLCWWGVWQEFKGAVDDGSVPEVNIREVRPLLDLEHFKVEVIEKRNSAAAGLCSWVVNIVQYYDIVRTVEPKRRALQEANDQLEAANVELGEVRWL